MKLSDSTLSILRHMATINSNIVINKGKKISSISPGSSVIAYYEGDTEFDDKISLFNLNEFLSVLDAFKDPELELRSKDLTISSGKAKVNYIYADESLLQKVPSKEPNFSSILSFELTSANISSIQKMSGILAANDLSIEGNGKSISLKVFDAKNPSANSYVMELDGQCKEKFTADFKIDRLKLLKGDYVVDFDKKKIAKFSHKGLNLVIYVGLEATSEF